MKASSGLTADQKQLILRITDPAGASRTLSGEQFLAEVGLSDGHTVAHKLLLEGLAAHDASDVELGLMLVSEFGVTPQFEEVLGELTRADWHRSYANVVNRLLDLGTPAVVPTLVDLALRQPSNLDEIDTQTLANNAAWALFKIGTPLALEGLERVAREGSAETGKLAGRLSAELDGA